MLFLRQAASGEGSSLINCDTVLFLLFKGRGECLLPAGISGIFAAETMPADVIACLKQQAERQWKKMEKRLNILYKTEGKRV